jgi:hypothetical protein
MPAPPSSPIDPAISQLLAAAQSLDQEPAQLLPVLSERGGIPAFATVGEAQVLVAAGTGLA